MTLVAAVQIASTPDIQFNLENASEWIAKAAKNGVQIAVLPEEFISLSLTPEEKLAMAETYQHGPLQDALSKIAQKNKIWVIGGTLPLKTSDKNKVTSSCLVWNDRGEPVGRYDKIHLFDVMVDEDEIYKESDLVQAGNKIEVLATPFGKIGIAICYDLRFPELFRVMMLKGADIIVLPSAFTNITGMVHWESLLKARAIENLCYVVAPGQVGMRRNQKKTHGHSIIIDPWGAVLDCLDQGEGLVLGKIDLEKMYQIRKIFPAHLHYQPFVSQELATLSESSKNSTARGNK